MPPTPTEYCLLWLDHWSTCMSKSEWSGWVQAIGSILAIAGAGVLLYLQLRASRHHAIEAEKRLLLRRYTAISAVAEFAEAEIRHVCSAASALCQMQVASPWINQSYRLNIARGELETVRKSALDSSHLVKGTRNMAVCIDGALQINTELTAGGVGPGTMSHIHRPRIDSEAIRTAGDAAEALSEVRSALKELTNDPGIGFAYLKVAERLMMEFL